MTRDAAASVKARLLARAKAAGEEFERTLVRYASERLLYRLGASSVRERCVLKGATLLAVWTSEPHRATRDVDLLRLGAIDPGAVRTLLEQICSVPCPEDGLSYELADLTIEPIRAEEQYEGQRARFTARLGKAKIAVQVDLGTGDALGDWGEDVELPVLLEGLPPAYLRAYPRELVIAEKLEATVKLADRNSRMKDFHDLWALSTAFAFDGPRLRSAVDACFRRRGTRWDGGIPAPLTPAFYSRPNLEARWSAYLTGGSVLVPPPRPFPEIGDRLMTFLGPIRESIVRGEPFDRHWREGGPWHPRNRA